MKKIGLLFAMVLLVQSCFASYEASTKCHNHIKNYEKCSLKSYWDANGWSIGWGHHSSDVKKGQKISQNRADKLFRADCKEAETYANWLIKQLPYKYKFSQGFFDGLTSLVYNAGVGNIQKSSFYQRLKRCRVSNGSINKQDLEYTLSAVKTTCISEPGHKSRRAAEYIMMRS